MPIQIKSPRFCGIFHALTSVWAKNALFYAIISRFLYTPPFSDSQHLEKSLVNQRLSVYNRNAMNYDIQDICDLVIKSGRKYILISGDGASGKSTLTHNLQDMLQNTTKTVSVFHTDDFMLDKEYRKKNAKNIYWQRWHPKNAIYGINLSRGLRFFTFAFRP